jgi:hypothetical protein
MTKQKKPQKEILFDGQHDDEEVIYVFRQHPVVMRKGLLAILIGILIGLIPMTIWPPLEITLAPFLPIIAGIVIGSFVLFYQWIGWFYTVFIVSDQRFIQINQHGMFNRSVNDISLEKILSVNFSVEGIEETMLGFGTIIVQTFVGDMTLKKIHHPAKVQERIVKIMKELGIENHGTPI